MSEATTYVGMDVHKQDIAVCLLSGDGKEAQEWTVAHTKQSVHRLLRRLKRDGGSGVESAYEAGPCGYALMRQFQGAGVSCQVVAPSLVPVRPGERIKTDRRDARKLAEMLRAGLLVEVHPPSEEEEDMLDLAFGLTRTSRLGCQVVMTDTLDGLTVRLPESTRNLLLEG